jgi:hypothetical protein|eukprot:COSAG06_NODE_7087_length_2639_cov_6.196850_4_plen_101_part_00
MLEVSFVTNTSVFQVRDLWAKKQLYGAKAGGFTVTVAAHDIQIFRLSKPKPTSVRRAAVAAAVVGNESSIHRHPGRRAMTESGRAGDKETTSNQTVEPVK